eukprot:TRINITY_DN2252_c0_g1_i1.p1 TRINITY_DN2252_c0_g1~~TRINITY_DN2252_c0_g1_i1.p1  ORF type:complete len:630 (-),score=127.71 TRINITY_DN2252_c0_g1_i1:82-1779(-)
MCTICGEIVISDVAPEICITCGAGKEMFVCIGAADAKPEKKSEKALFKWMCTVCGDVFISDVCPTVCATCGAGKEFFQCLGPADSPVAQDAQDAAQSQSAHHMTAGTPPTVTTVAPTRRCWRCSVCGDLSAPLDAQPAACSLCGAGKDLLVAEEIMCDITLKGLDCFNGHILIVGAGGAGIAALKAIREANKICSVTMVSTEPYKPYSRPALVKMLQPEMIDKAKLLPENYFEENKVTLLLGTKVASINYSTKQAKVIKPTGEDVIHFDKLILATGGYTGCPMSDCLDSKLTNVFGVRTIDDIKAIGAFIKKNDPKICALIGGGLTCLEMAESLHHFGIKSHIIEMAPMLLPNQLAEMGSKAFTKVLEENGVMAHTNIKTKGLSKNADGTMATGVVTDVGLTINADFILFSVGTRPTVDLAKSIEGLKINNGIIVDSHMETSLSGVYSCGDCAEFDGRITPNWTVASAQGRIAGINSLKAADWITYTPEPSPYAMCCFTTVFSCGSRTGEENVVIRRGCNVIELWFTGGSLVGVVLVGKEVGVFTQDLKAAIKERKSFKQVMALL